MIYTFHKLMRNVFYFIIINLSIFISILVINLLVVISGLAFGLNQYISDIDIMDIISVSLYITIPIVFIYWCVIIIVIHSWYQQEFRLINLMKNGVDYFSQYDIILAIDVYRILTCESSHFDMINHYSHQKGISTIDYINLTDFRKTLLYRYIHYVSDIFGLKITQETEDLMVFIREKLI